MIARCPLRRVRFGPPRRGRKLDEPYLRWLRSLSCVVCGLRKGRSSWPHVEAAHVGPRGLGIKCHDREALPLCVWHHTAGPESAHVLQRKFWQHWGLDRFGLIAEYNERYRQETQWL